MNEQRHNFKQTFIEEKIKFIDRMFSFIDKMDITDENKEFFKDIAEYLSKKDEYACNFLYLETILKYELSHYDNCSKEKLVNDIIQKMNNVEDTDNSHLSQYHNIDQLKNIANEFKQINKQAKEILGNGVVILDGVDIIKTNDESQESYLDTLEYVESIDLCIDIDENPSQIEEMDFNIHMNNIVCIFCEGNHIILMSSIEGYCYDCDKSFYIKKRD